MQLLRVARQGVSGEPPACGTYTGTLHGPSTQRGSRARATHSSSASRTGAGSRVVRAARRARTRCEATRCWAPSPSGRRAVHVSMNSRVQIRRVRSGRCAKGLATPLDVSHEPAALTTAPCHGPRRTAPAALSQTQLTGSHLSGRAMVAFMADPRRCLPATPVFLCNVQA